MRMHYAVQKILLPTIYYITHEDVLILVHMYWLDFL